MVNFMLIMTLMAFWDVMITLLLCLLRYFPINLWKNVSDYFIHLEKRDYCELNRMKKCLHQDIYSVFLTIKRVKI